MRAAADVDSAVCGIEHFGQFEADTAGGACDDVDAAAEFIERFFCKRRGRWEDLGKIRHCVRLYVCRSWRYKDWRRKKML